MNEIVIAIIVLVLFFSWITFSLFAVNFWFKQNSAQVKVNKLHQTKIFFWWYGFVFLCFTILGFVAGFVTVLAKVLLNGLGY